MCASDVARPLPELCKEWKIRFLFLSPLRVELTAGHRVRPSPGHCLTLSTANTDWAEVADAPPNLNSLIYPWAAFPGCQRGDLVAIPVNTHRPTSEEQLLIVPRWEGKNERKEKNNEDVCIVIRAGFERAPTHKALGVSAFFFFAQCAWAPPPQMEVGCLCVWNNDGSAVKTCSFELWKSFKENPDSFAGWGRPAAREDQLAGTRQGGGSMPASPVKNQQVRVESLRRNPCPCACRSVEVIWPSSSEFTDSRSIGQINQVASSAARRHTQPSSVLKINWR